MRYFKQLLGLFLVVSLSVVTLLVPAHANDKLKVDLQIINLEADGSTHTKSEYWVEENIPAAADITVSGEGAAIPEAWARLTVPKINGKITKPNFVDSKKAYETIHTEDAENWYVTYKFKELAGGNRLTFPFPFKFIDRPTNNRDTIDIKFDLLDGTAEGTEKPVLYSTNKVYTALKQQFEYNHSVLRPWNENRYDRNEQIYYYNVNVNEGVTNTGDPGARAQVAVSAAVVVPDGTTGRISFVEPENLKMVVTLPEDVSLAPNSTGPWTYDEATRTLTILHNKPGVEGSYSPRENRPGKTYWPTFVFKNRPFNEPHTLNARYFVDAGLPT